MMTLAHVLRLGSTPEPEKVNPLVPRQQGDNLLRLHPSEGRPYGVCVCAMHAVVIVLTIGLFCFFGERWGLSRR